jgi:predicted DNA-binding transcriptional regulator AlpA
MPRKPVPKFQDPFLDTPEVAELTGISEPALEADRCTGQLGIPYYKFASRVRYRLSEVLAWAEERRVTPPGR